VSALDRVASSTRFTTHLLVAIVVSAVATIASRTLPDSIVATAVGGIFLAATWLLVLRDRGSDARAWGLAVGGVLETPPAPWSVTLRELAIAIGWALLFCALVFPAFAVGFARYHHRTLSWTPPVRPFDAVLGQLIVVALPEEAFFRGYVQTAFDRSFRGRVRILGADVGMGLVLSSAIFAFGHLATVWNPARLAVFFPSLVFGWMRARTGGIGAGVLFHATCNLLSDGLARGAGLY
jgi:membrane protease YdiL (CAAX protease family)